MTRSISIAVIFVIFSATLVLALIFIAVEHSLSRKELDNEIDKMKGQFHLVLQRRRNKSINPSLRRITKTLIEDERNCDVTQNTIKLAGNHSSTGNSNDFEVWNMIPRPFIALQMRNLALSREYPDESSEDDSFVVEGWVEKQISKCNKLHPQLHDGQFIRITHSGYYYIYSFLRFACSHAEKASHHRHIVKLQEVTDAEFYPLMHSSYQLCGSQENRIRSSFQAGVYKMEEGNLLRVSVNVMNINHLSATQNWEFGAYFL